MLVSMMYHFRGVIRWNTSDNLLRPYMTREVYIYCVVAWIRKVPGWHSGHVNHLLYEGAGFDSQCGSHFILPELLLQGSLLLSDWSISFILWIAKRGAVLSVQPSALDGTLNIIVILTERLKAVLVTGNCWTVLLLGVVYLDSYSSFWRTKVDCEGRILVGKLLFCVEDPFVEDDILGEGSSSVSGFSFDLCDKFEFTGLEDEAIPSPSLALPFLFFALGVMEVGDTIVDVDDILGGAEDFWELWGAVPVSVLPARSPLVPLVFLDKVERFGLRFLPR